MSKVAQAADAVIEGVKVFVGRRLAPIEQRLAALEAERSKTLADAFMGGWMAGREYKRGALVQHADALWLAMTETDERPGQSPAWRALAPTR